jgi:prepilin-type N-terminal cleavage/methylation domain-containing protein
MSGGLSASSMNQTELKKMRQKGFTFIEVIIAMTLIAVTFVPLMKMFTVAIDNINNAKVMTTAVSIGREYMEMVKNLNLPEERLKKLESSAIFPPLSEPPIGLNDVLWRVKRVVYKDTDPVRVDILVYEEGEKEPVFTLSTLFEDIY